METIDELLESAARRTFMVTIKTKPGAKKFVHQVCIVQALSPRGAKQAAANRMAKGKFQHMRFSDWVFESVEEVGQDKTLAPDL